MTYRCESCKTVQVSPRCRCGQPARPMTDAESAAYVLRGHEAFGDLVAVTDEQGGIVRYDAR